MEAGIGSKQEASSMDAFLLLQVMHQDKEDTIKSKFDAIYNVSEDRIYHFFNFNAFF